jgi:polyphosphate kinase 2 (PPK2 family)
VNKRGHSKQYKQGVTMKIDSEDSRVRSGGKVKLQKWPACVKPCYKSKEHYQEILRIHIEQLSAMQSLLYACNRYALLLASQAMDGAIRHVMPGVNPQGCQVFSFKQSRPLSDRTLSTRHGGLGRRAERAA